MQTLIPEGEGPFPALVLVHGGGWVAGTPSLMSGLARFLTDAGYLTVNTAYTLSNGIAGFPWAVDDVACAVRHAAARTITRRGLTQSLGIAGVIAPAITDSLHPSFYFNSLLIGRFCEQQWGPATAPIPARFRYPLFADPQIAQFFPPVDANETDADQLGVILQDAVEGLSTSIVDPQTRLTLRALASASSSRPGWGAFPARSRIFWE